MKIMMGLKMIVCEKHTSRVFYPLGCVCPACYPAMYPKLDEIKITEPTTLTLKPLESRVIYITAGEPCPVCDGQGDIKAGENPLDWVTCAECRGSGVVFHA